MGKVSIILLNWRSVPIIYDAAETAIAQAGVDVELIIVDNNSDDGSLPELRRRYPRARIVALSSNLGFAGGMNAGIAVATREFVLLQNADLLLAPDHCAKSVAAMQSDERLGAVGGHVYRLVGTTRTTQLDACGYVLGRQYRVRFVDPAASTDVMGVSGSSPFLRVEALRDVSRHVGYVLDPWYFTSFEDVDLMLRLRLAGWRVRYDAGIHSWHQRSYSTGQSTRFFGRTARTVEHHFKNRISTIVKTAPAALAWRIVIPLVATELLLPAFLVIRRPSLIRALVRAWRAVWSERRRLLSDRKLIQKVARERNTVPDFIRNVGRLLRTS